MIIIVIVDCRKGYLDENESIQCSYHDLPFKIYGSCAQIPQAASEGPEAIPVGSPQACAMRFPTTISQGLLFMCPTRMLRKVLQVQASILNFIYITHKFLF